MALLSRGGKTPPKTTVVTAKPEDSKVKYPKPKVLLLDVDSKSEAALRNLGLNVTVGSFGRPYKVQKSDGFQPVIVKASFPNHKEQEIVVVDLWYEQSADTPQGEKHQPDGTSDVWARCDTGKIDPRPRAMLSVKTDFDRILSHGGAFVIFTEDKDVREMHLGRISYRDLQIEQTLNVDNWSFLSALDELYSVTDHGSEMNCAIREGVLPALLAKHLEGGDFSCTFEPHYHAKKDWAILAKNKFDAGVAAGRIKDGEGLVLVLPQIADKPGFLEQLFSGVLPALCPKLFPHIEKGLWTHLPEYELPRILELERQQSEIEARAKAQIADLNSEIGRERANSGWIHDLLTGTDTQLVGAVKKALALIGFAKVVDVDEERDKEGKSRREDLQIHDASPTLIVDIKGIGNFPSDEDALQAAKHAAIRMKEWKRTDVVGLSLLNHQRHIPPLDRDNAMPFRQELIDAAHEMTLGLLTSWDVYRMIRNIEVNNWPTEHVRPLFYNVGRIEVMPEHYEYLGVVVKAWTDKFGVVIENVTLKVGDRIAVEFPILFFEEPVKSIHVNDKSVNAANIGDPAGIPWSKANSKLREGMRVFRVRK